MNSAETRKKEHLNHGNGFIGSARERLADAKPEPGLVDIFTLDPTHPAYIEFLEFIKDELEQLPFDGSRGTVRRRQDAPAVIDELTGALSDQLERIRAGEAWNPNLPKDLSQTFTAYPNLELFKNIILPGQNPDIGYSVDLGVVFVDGQKSPASVNINRYSIVPTPEAVTGTEDGSISLDLTAGLITLDLNQNDFHVVQELPKR
jgi:hypothetical protein